MERLEKMRKSCESGKKKVAVEDGRAYNMDKALSFGRDGNGRGITILSKDFASKTLFVLEGVF